MKLSQLKEYLHTANAVNFLQPDGNLVPLHFHITEAGINTKHFIDCGGTIRTEKHINFQVWAADDMNHRLQPQKLLKIIAASEKVLGNEDLDVEVEYQNETIGRYGLETDGSNLLLIPKQTNCLAKENCAIPSSTEKENFKPLSAQTACCEPASSCC